MDGVLVNSGPVHLEAWIVLGKEIGAPVDRAYFDRTFGMHGHAIVQGWLGRDLPRARLEELCTRKEEIYRELARQRLEPLLGVEPLIRGLHAEGFRLAVGSSGPKENVEMVLELLGVRSLFQAWTTGDEVAHGKPDPEVFTKTVTKLDCGRARAW